MVFLVPCRPDRLGGVGVPSSGSENRFLGIRSGHTSIESQTVSIPGSSPPRQVGRSLAPRRSTARPPETLPSFSQYPDLDARPIVRRSFRFPSCHVSPTETGRRPPTGQAPSIRLSP